jgi:hypothetical protein
MRWAVSFGVVDEIGIDCKAEPAGPNLDDFNNARATFGASYIIARGAAFVLHFDVAFILLPVCRNFISLMRRTPLNSFIPFDGNITFRTLLSGVHIEDGVKLTSRADKATAWSLVFFTAVHVIAHIRNAVVLAETYPNPVPSFFLVNFATGPFLTGWIMTAFLAIMVFFAIEKRRRAHFERFWYSHHLFIPFFILWQLHG